MKSIEKVSSKAKKLFDDHHRIQEITYLNGNIYYRIIQLDNEELKYEKEYQVFFNMNDKLYHHIVDAKEAYQKLYEEYLSHIIYFIKNYHINDLKDDDIDDVTNNIEN